MRNNSWKAATAVAVAATIATLASPVLSAADQVSGRITRTYVMVENTDLVGDVTCDVENSPCFSFGASGIELRLNGFTITGRADAATGCSGATSLTESGISTNGSNSVSVRGPGVVERFRGRGLIVVGSSNARAHGFTVSTTCSSGIFVAANSFGTLVEGIVAVRNGASDPGFACGGIWIIGHNSRVRLNDAHGNGYARPPDDFGIGVLGTGSDNVVELNTVTGNTKGIFIGPGARSTLIRNNTVVGNPPIQVGISQPEPTAADIVNMAPAGQTTFDRNVCITGVNAPCPGRNR